ncbi:MAG: hypothetical protein AAF682_23435 [Planctomycetota bacterium]
MRTFSYARARLWLGISGVGTFVVLASALLTLDAPSRLLGGRGGSLAVDAALLFGVLVAAAALALPFDVLGGLVLPRRFGRPAPDAGRFAARWARGVIALAVISATAGALLLLAGRAGGRGAALAVLVACSLALVTLQEPLARLVGGLRRAGADALRVGGIEPDSVVVLEGDDPGFSGGFTGLRPVPVVPKHWLRALGPRTLALLVERRRRILRSGAWKRSLTLAVLFNATGFLLASLLPGAGVTAVSELVATSLGFTLWTFLGLLLLPTLSRRATLAADALVLHDDDGLARERLELAVRTLDGLQDDEPERSPGVESVFHPVPSVASRLRALAAPRAGGPGAWHLARTSLFLSHAGLSLLPRAVHCNAGRPELWVYLPADG